VSAAVVAPSRTAGHTILAFDYGERHIGIAVGDTGTRIAHPVGMVRRPRAAVALSEIDILVREWRPGELLVGLPVTADGGEHPLATRVRRFARQLSARYRIPVGFADERFSSSAAEQLLRASGRGGQKYKHATHALAASTVLQAYLDESPRR
jgi:putative Holliday junction resolvase